MTLRRSAWPLPFLFASLALAAGCPGSGKDGPGDILDELAAIDGMTVVEQPTALPGYRLFHLAFEQPVDHDAPQGPRFPQRMTLLHRGYHAPMILHSSGYNVSTTDGRVELTFALEANQLRLEHRWFTPSRPPDPADWSDLDIRQSANDSHRVVDALKPLYKEAWINTGGSKGGMTSIYHRRFFPADVDATVAYVAPSSLGVDDARYVTFLDAVGDAGCRADLLAFQRNVLMRRAAMLQRIQDQEVAAGITFNHIGRDKALEHSALELPFAFWQYQDASLCPAIPAAGATDDEVFDFLNIVSAPSFFADEDILFFEPYYYQAGEELGYPAISETNVSDLLVFPGTDRPESYLPTATPAPPVFDPSAMADVRQWVETEGSELLFIYGENDPWSAGAFTLGAATDSFRLTAPAGNHGSRIGDLVPADQTIALEAIQRWTGVTPVLPVFFAPLDAIESEPRRRSIVP